MGTTRLHAILPFTRHVLNPVLRRLAAWLPGFALLTFTGRTTGRRYTTPMNVFVRDGRYVFALTYGSDAAWVRNVLATGRAELRIRRRTIHLVEPELFVDPTRRLMPAPAKLILGRAGVDEFLRMRPVEDSATA